MKEPVAISSGVELDAVKPVDPPELLLEAAGSSAKPASAIVAGPADKTAGPFAALLISVSIVWPPKVAFDSPAATLETGAVGVT